MDLHWLTDAFAADAEVPLATALVRLAAAVALGLGVALVCRSGKGGAASSRQRALLATLVLLTVLLALTTIIIGSNVARAFSIVGALSIVRFRTVVSDTRDTAFVICAVAVGMAAGAGYFVLPLLALPVVAAAAWLFRPRQAAVLAAGATHRLVITGAADAAPHAFVHEAFVRHRVQGFLAEAATQDGGTRLERCWELTLPDEVEAQALVVELGRAPGVASVELRQS